MFGKSVGRLGAVGSRTPTQRAIAVLRKFGADAHVYLPGVGMLNGLQAGNYLDSAGTQAGEVDQPVGLVLDAAGGLGPELVTNGDFSNGLIGWVSQQPTVGSVAIVSGAVRVNSADGTIASVSQNMGLIVGKTYKVTFDLTVATGTFALQNGSQNTSYTSQTTSGVKEIFATAIDATLVFKRLSGVSDFTVDNISVREVTGIAASQPTTANKSVLKLTNGRYNWLFDSTDLLTATYPAGYESVTVIDARSTGQVTTAGANIVGAYSMGPSVTLYGRMIVKGVLTASELALLQRFANSLAGL